MAYPGNQELSPEIRQRVMETFRQTLELAEQGSQREAQLGCDFILRLDPLFEPARMLQQRLGSPDTLKIEDLRDLLPTAAPADPAATVEVRSEDAAPSSPPEPDLGDLGSIELDEPESAPGVDTPESAEEDLEQASGLELDSESKVRIRELLDEGQAAFEQREYQMAIDAWSRIFLIDIDHPEANRRIERARRLKAEIERSVEESLHEGIALAEGGEVAAAREVFERIVEEHPHYADARERLERLERADKGGPAPEPEAAAPSPPPMAPPGPEPGQPAAPPALSTPPSGERTAGDRAAAAQPRIAPMQAAKDSEPGRRLFVTIGSAVLLLVLIGGWFVLSNWSRIFPNATGTGNGFDPIERAEELHLDGQTSIAIAQLRRVPPEDRSYARAQELIETWQGALTAAPSGEFELDDELAERAEILARAEIVHQAGDLIGAEALYSQAHAIASLDGQAAADHRALLEYLDPVRDQIEVFRQGEWEIALRTLWRRHHEQPDNQVITGMMVDCYYNLGVRELQRGDALAASEMFREARGLRPGDRQLDRLARFAETYQHRSQDLLYRIFVKYLPFR